MLRLTAFALLGLAVAAGCGGNSSPFTEAEGGEGSGAESNGGSSGTGTTGGTSGAAGNSSGGVGGSSGASGDGGTTTGGVSTGGTDAGGSDAGGTDAGGTSSGGSGNGGTDAGGSGGAQGGGSGLGGTGALGGASGSTGTGGSAGATTTDPKCPVREPASGSTCTQVALRCPYDASGCRCLTVQADRCFQLDTTCFAMGAADRIAPPPAHYCTCSAIPDRSTPGWTCAPLPQ